MVQNDKFTLEDAELVIKNGKEEAHVNYSLQVLEQCLDTYKPDELFLSFNGGKDCTATLHLISALFKTRGIPLALNCLYVTEDTFHEVDDFVEKATTFYNINLIRKTKPMKLAVINLLNDNKRIKAAIMGIRKDDPGSDKLQSFSYTDSDWPKIMRISPILNWSYNQVWQFLLKHNVPYCSLYDKGYSSIGNKNSTLPNPSLIDPNDSSKYLPAYTLSDSSTERSGRN